jgi:hypothetical protein
MTDHRYFELGHRTLPTGPMRRPQRVGPEGQLVEPHSKFAERSAVALLRKAVDEELHVSQMAKGALVVINDVGALLVQLDPHGVGPPGGC